ncbi:MAG: cyclic nucleotide-binding domain-containing protein [Candidatus Omnitrophica bacterium]|nr:cyclic nucleotide-binding domain-containing protein [Candidatus Omnitrophota bacterium]
MIKEELVTILANIPPFNKLNRKGNLEFARICEVKEYQNAQTIYREGDAPGYFYLLLRGRVVALTSDSGIDSEIELLKRGTSFGVISLFTDEPHSVTTQSIEDSIIIRVERSAFKGFLEKYPVISLDFSRILSSRVKRRKSPKKIFQCKRIGVIGYHASGKTNYTINLSRQLKKQTKKNVICVEIRAKDDFTTPSLINADCRPLVLKNFNEDQLCDYIAVDEVDHLLVQVDSGSRFLRFLIVFLRVIILLYVSYRVNY